MKADNAIKNLQQLMDKWIWINYWNQLINNQNFQALAQN